MNRSWLCAYFGHRWKPFTEDGRECRRCVRCRLVQRKYRIVIPPSTLISDTIVINTNGRNYHEWLDDDEPETGTEQP